MNDETQSGRRAVALKYDGVNAPRVTAKGEDEIADRIVEIARAHDIPLHEDARLAWLLAQLELGDEIPRTLYVVIAEIIAFAYLVSGKASAYGTRVDTPLDSTDH